MYKDTIFAGIILTAYLVPSIFFLHTYTELVAPLRKYKYKACEWDYLNTYSPINCPSSYLSVKALSPLAVATLGSPVSPFKAPLSSLSDECLYVLPPYCLGEKNIGPLSDKLAILMTISKVHYIDVYPHYHAYYNIKYCIFRYLRNIMKNTTILLIFFYAMQNVS